jgi:GT2 family glycosyltransferase
MKDSNKIVSICIVNWNGIKYLDQCLNSIYAQDYSGEVEIIVVDNNSADGSVEYLESRSRVKLIKNDTNKGFSCGHNQAKNASRGSYILPLNFDIFINNNFVSEMVKTIESDPDIGIVSGKLYKQIEGIKSNILDSTGITMKHFFMSPRGETEQDEGQYDDLGQRRVFGACGAAPFLRKTMLEDICVLDEYFDEDFVNYVEDVDLCWRAQLRGWICVYNPMAIAYHERGVTRKNSSKIKKGYLVYGFRNRYCSMAKNISSEYWKKNRAKIICREITFLLSSYNGVSHAARFKALFLAIPMLKKMLKKRKMIQQRKLAKDDYMDNFFCYNEVELKQLAKPMLSLLLLRKYWPKRSKS